MTVMERRPVAVRGSRWAQATARALSRTVFTPNQISGLSVAFAAAGAAVLAMWPTRVGMLLCALGIVLRLGCNMFDGMVAVEGGKRTAAGPLFNELPDRVADALFLVALGQAIAMPWLGWLCAWLAALAAYLRAFGSSLGQPQDFGGPMAKPQRMWLLAIALIVAAVAFRWRLEILFVAAALIAAGTATTCLRRTVTLAARLRASEHA